MQKFVFIALDVVMVTIFL